ncbi:acetyltransferase (plasmid) [Deinococcus proteolyticus MRP]|uniref:Acetyltransferase n=1 Tax=Deinococcus proteolyticus (strain ATCC 35074 / DSM 20540 / JCM 6276 / NBRC 101906 / NCIMB 13154 / VKM Ac-1939 / CCM 2703 / MRP) TaxID=693977 RepID=F0RPJ7_DEIPM|nr:MULTISPECIES: GNAT family N-acetyltransferase [Deinococcus]ADY27303.1 acetyltransferase [Deinococcus proteolyticus MRP]MCY1704172.1 GNAT family N-acetyltransferase [Deinococcus sp. SL84]
MQLDIRHNETEQRYEAYQDGQLVGHLAYEDLGNAALLTHTEIDPQSGGKGYGSQLVAGALEGLRQQGKSVVPQCPFVASFIQKHPEYLELVHPNQRGQLSMEERESR